MKTVSLLLLICLMPAFPALSQHLTLPLWDDTPPFQTETGLEEIHERDGILRISNVQSPTLEVYLPDEEIATGKAVLLFPGGGYAILAYEWEGTEFARWLQEHGIAAMVVKYRLPLSKSLTNPKEVPLADAQRAIRMVRHYAPEWGIDPGRVGIMGFSAGGHLAATLSTQYDVRAVRDDEETDLDSEKSVPGDVQSDLDVKKTVPGDVQSDLIVKKTVSGDVQSDPDVKKTFSGNTQTEPTAIAIDSISARPDFTVLVYPVISLRDVSAHSGSRRNLLGEEPSQQLIDRFSAELHVNSDTPPAFLVHSQDDTGVPAQNSLLYFEALTRHGVPASLHVYPEGGHGFAFGNGQGLVEEWTSLLLSWLNTF